MLRRNQLLIILLCIITAFTATDGLAQKRKLKTKKSKAQKQLPAETVISFKANQFKECGDSLIIDHHTLMVSHLENDSATCSFGNDEDVLWLYPAALYVKLNRTRTIKTIEIIVNDNCRPECTVANLYNFEGEFIAKATNQFTSEDETLSFDVPDDFGTLAITSYEGMVKLITIVYK